MRTAALPFVDYKAQYEVLVTPTTTDGPNGYDFLLEVHTIAEPIIRQIDEHQRGTPDTWHPLEIHRSPDGRELAVHPDLEMLLEWTADPELQRLLDELAAATWFAPPIPAADILMALEPWPETSQTRNVAFWEAARLSVAHAAGDHEAALRSLRRCMALARAAEARRAIMPRLLGISIRAIATRALRDSLAHRPAPEAVVARYLVEIDRFSLIDVSETVEAERLLMLDGIQGIYHGHAGAPGLGQAAVGIPRLLLASQRSSVDEAERLFNMLRTIVRNHPIRDRAAQTGPFDVAMDGLGRRHLALSILMPSWRGVLRNDVMFLTQLNGTRLMLAIEMHRARHGSPPSSLDELVPGLLPALPVDHYAPDGRFGYRVLTDTDADPDGRVYLLYSLGFDGIDNGGVMPEPGEMSESGRSLAYPFSDPGYDWVANHGFERQAKADADDDGDDDNE